MNYDLFKKLSNGVADPLPTFDRTFEVVRTVDPIVGKKKLRPFIPVPAKDRKQIDTRFFPFLPQIGLKIAEAAYKKTDEYKLEVTKEELRVENEKNPDKKPKDTLTPKDNEKNPV